MSVIGLVPSIRGAARYILAILIAAPLLCYGRAEILCALFLLFLVVLRRIGAGRTLMAVLPELPLFLPLSDICAMCSGERGMPGFGRKVFGERSERF
jgi:hypothetical protein